MACAAVFKIGLGVDAVAAAIAGLGRGEGKRVGMGTSAQGEDEGRQNDAGIFSDLESLQIVGCRGLSDAHMGTLLPFHSFSKTRFTPLCANTCRTLFLIISWVLGLFRFLGSRQNFYSDMNAVQRVRLVFYNCFMAGARGHLLPCAELPRWVPP